MRLHQMCTATNDVRWQLLFPMKDEVFYLPNENVIGFVWDLRAYGAPFESRTLLVWFES